MLFFIKNIYLFINILPKNLIFGLIFSAIFSIVISFLDILNVSLLVPFGFKIINSSLPNWLENISFINDFFQSVNSLIFLLITLFLIKLILVFFLIKYNSFLIFKIKSFLQLNNLKSHISLNYAEHIKKSLSEFLNDCHLNITIFLDNFVKQIINSVSDIATLILIIISLLAYDFKFFFIILFFLFLTIFINKIYLQKSLFKIGKLREIQDANIMRIFKDMFQSFREIKLNSSENRVFNKVLANVESANYLYAQRNRKAQIISYAMEFIVVLMILSMVFVFENYYGLGKIDSIIVGMVFFLRLIPVKNRLISTYQALNYSRTIVDRFLKNLCYLNEKKEPLMSDQIKIEKSIGKTVPALETIEFNNVSFSHDDNKEVLSNINFKFQKGDKILIQGESGSGKSTLLDIFSSLQKPTKGSLFVNNISIKENDNYFKRISYVSQNNYFIDGSIYQNLNLYSDVSFNKDTVYEKLRITNSLEFIEKLPKKIETDLHLNASELSGGQKQRLALTRGLMKDFDFLILDEATNALDYDNEQMIINNIFSEFRKCGILIVSHNKNLNVKFNYILKIVDGRLIIEEG